MKIKLKTRKQIYAVSIALVPLLVTAGVVTADQSSYILNILAAVLAVGNSALALGNAKEL